MTASNPIYKLVDENKLVSCIKTYIDENGH